MNNYRSQNLKCCDSCIHSEVYGTELILICKNSFSKEEGYPKVWYTNICDNYSSIPVES